MIKIIPTGDYEILDERFDLHISTGRGNTDDHAEVHIAVMDGDRQVAQGWYRVGDIEGALLPGIAQHVRLREPAIEEVAA